MLSWSYRSARGWLPMGSITGQTRPLPVELWGKVPPDRICDLCHQIPRGRALSSKHQIYSVAAGDIFTVPLDDGEVALGQVIGKYTKALYVIVFDLVASSKSVQTLHFSDVTAATPLLARMTFDARFRPGMWQIVGNSVPDQRRFLPAFSHGSEDYDGVHVTNFEGSRMRRATADEARRVPHLTIDSPMVLEKALRAHHGLEPWLPVYDDLRYRPTPTSWELFGQPRSARADSARAAPEQQSARGDDHDR